MRTLGLLTSAAVYAVALAACATEPDQSCREPTGTAYAVNAPGDPTVIFRWPGSYQPVRYWAEPVAANVANVFASLQLWVNGFRCGELTLEQVTDSNLADVLIFNPPFMPPLPARAVAVFADSVGACGGRTDILVDSLDRLELPVRAYVTPAGTDPVATEACYHFVTAHEVGHTLGLFSHSGTSGDLMHVTPRKRELTENDRLTIQLLYRLPSVPIVPQPR